MSSELKERISIGSESDTHPLRVGIIEGELVPQVAFEGALLLSNARGSEDNQRVVKVIDAPDRYNLSTFVHEFKLPCPNLLLNARLFTMENRDSTDDSADKTQ